jgi:hypothetical protein
MLGSTPATVGATSEKELAVWRPVVEKLNIKLD